MKVKKILKYYMSEHLKQYLANIDFKSITRTLPISSDGDSPVEIFILTSWKDTYMLLILLKSLYFFSNRSFKINIISDDGSLRPKDMKLIKWFIKDAYLILEKKEVLNKIKNYPTCTEFYLDHDPTVSKLIVPALMAKKEKIMVLDTDVCFFRHPRTIVDWMEGKLDWNFYLNGAKPRQVTAELARDISRIINIKTPIITPDTGIILFQKDILNLSVIEEIFSILKTHSYTEWTKELFTYGVLLQRSEKYRQLPPDYTGGSSFGATCNHYLSQYHLLKPSKHKIKALIEYIAYKERLGETEPDL